MAKKITLEETLTRLKKDLLGELNKIEEEENRAKFRQSVLVYDYSINSLKSQIRVDIKFEGKKPVGKELPEGAYKNKLVKKFRSWLNEALKAGMSSGNLKVVKSRDEVIQSAELVTFGRFGKTKLDDNKIRVWKSSSQLWFFSPNASDQKDSFRDTILKRAKDYAETKVNGTSDPDYVLFYNWLKSVHLGHTFGLKASQLSRVFKKPESGTISEAARGGKLELKLTAAESKALGPELQQAITKSLVRSLIVDIEVDVEKDINPKKDGVVLKKNIGMNVQGVRPEFGPENSATGAELKGRVVSLVTTTFRRILREAKKGVSAEELANLVSSKTVEDAIVDNIINTFKGKKPKTYKKKTTKRNTTKKRSKTKVKVEKIGLPAKLIAEISAVGEDIDLNSKIPYLNRRLHDKIQQNMGKGRAQQILNYRTGRFARSAEIQRFLPSKEKGAVNAEVKYMRYPYGTFEPPGRLHKPGRDPHRIFGRSIRQLLQEEKIATLRRVKVQLRG